MTGRVVTGAILGIGLGLPVAAVVQHAVIQQATAGIPKAAVVDAPRAPVPADPPERWQVIPGEDWHGLGRPPEPGEVVQAPDVPPEPPAPVLGPRKRAQRHHADDSPEMGTNGAPIIP